MKLKFIWQDPAYTERDWIRDLFSFAAIEEIVDGKHRIVSDNCLLIDSYLHGREPDYYTQFRGRNAWLFHLSDETYEGGYDLYRNFRGVFRNYWSEAFLPQRIVQLPLGYSDGFVQSTRHPAAELRPYVWSFLGEGNKASRPDVLKALLPITPAFVHRTDQAGQQPIGRREYQRMLCDSIFVPCPMGNVNLESFRVYEALECGAIPLLERRPTLDYFSGLLGNHPLPTFGNWNQAARFVSALQADRDALNKLQEQCNAWWIEYKRGLRKSIELFVATAHGEEPVRFTHGAQSLPGWQLAELMRHQTARTFARRIGLQIKRVLHEGRLRNTAGV